MGNYNEMRDAQECQPKLETGKAALQDYVGFSRSVRQQQTVNHFVFKCTKCACCWNKLDRSIMTDVEIWREVVNVKSVRRWTENLGKILEEHAWCTEFVQALRGQYPGRGSSIPV